jgi:hypothetical protein
VGVEVQDAQQPRQADQDEVDYALEVGHATAPPIVEMLGAQ